MEVRPEIIIRELQAQNDFLMQRALQLSQLLENVTIERNQLQADLDATKGDEPDEGAIDGDTE